MKIRTKLVIAASVSMAALAASAKLALDAAVDGMAGVVAERAVAGSARIMAALEQADVDTLDATVFRLLADPGVADAFARRDRARLAAIVVPRFRDVSANHGVTQWNFLLPDRTVFLRAQRPGEFGDLIERPVVVEAARSGDLAVGKDLGHTGFGLRLARPWAPGGRLLGYVEIGEEVAHFLARLKAQTGDDYAIVVEKRHLDHVEWAAVRAAAGKADGWEDLPGVVIVESTGPDRTALSRWNGAFASLPSEGAVIDHGTRDGKSHATGMVPISNAAGDRVGALLVRHDTTGVRADLARAARTALGVVGVLAVLAVLAMLLLVERLLADAPRGAP